MVVELLARSPATILGSCSPLASAMDVPGMSPGEKFVEPGIKTMETIEINVGETIIKIGIAGAMGIIGATAFGEAKEAIIDKLTEKCGKYQNGTSNEEVFTEPSINDIQTNDLDGTPEAQKTLVLNDDDDDVAIICFTTKKYGEFRASNNLIPTGILAFFCFVFFF